jgi:hypothetical protein
MWYIPLLNMDDGQWNDLTWAMNLKISMIIKVSFGRGCHLQRKISIWIQWKLDLTGSIVFA